MTEPDNDPTAPSTIFLLGPPGVGKSTLGSRACTELGLEFLDLGATGVQPPADTDVLIERLRSRASSGAADVIELPWPLQQENRALRLARRLGVTLLLWAHPEDMHARSGLDKPFVTPVPRLKTRGGFGRNGTGCKEFRRLDRACEEVLLLVDVPRDEAVDALTDYIELLVSEHQQSPVEREGLLAWIDDWHQDHDADPQASRVIVEAMAAYLRHLRAEGRSPRSVRAVVADLNAAGHLVCAYDAPDADKALSSFHAPPWEFAYRRKFSESDALVARYRRSLEGFAQFLDDRDA